MVKTGLQLESNIKVSLTVENLPALIRIILTVHNCSNTLTLEPTKNILQPFYRRLLPRIKINRNMPSALIPIQFYMGGFKLRSLEMEQIIGGFSIVISYFNSTHQTSDLMKQSLEHVQLESGLSTPVLLASFESYSHLITQGWLHKILKSLSYFKMELHLPSRHHPMSPVSNDRTIMEMAISSKQFNKDQTCLINIVRIKLQVVFISDMLEHGTNRIKEKYQKGEKDRFTISSFHCHMQYVIKRLLNHGKYLLYIFPMVMVIF